MTGRWRCRPPPCLNASCAATQSIRHQVNSAADSNQTIQRKDAPVVRGEAGSGRDAGCCGDGRQLVRDLLPLACLCPLQPLPLQLRILLLLPLLLLRILLLRQRVERGEAGWRVSAAKPLP